MKVVFLGTFVVAAMMSVSIASAAPISGTAIATVAHATELTQQVRKHRCFNKRTKEWTVCD